MVVIEMCVWLHVDRKEENIGRNVGTISLVIDKGRLRCFGRVEYKADADWIKLCTTMETDGTRRWDI